MKNTIFTLLVLLGGCATIDRTPMVGQVMRAKSPYMKDEIVLVVRVDNYDRRGDRLDEPLCFVKLVHRPEEKKPYPISCSELEPIN